MEYKSITNLLYNTPYRPSKFTIKIYWNLMNHERGTYKEDNQSRFKSLMLRSSLCDNSDACILVKGTIAVPKETGAALNYSNKKLIFKYYAPFTNWCWYWCSNANV